MAKDKPDNPRLSINLTAEDNSILTELRYVLEKRMECRLSLAEIVRMAIRTQAKSEGIKCK